MTPVARLHLAQARDHVEQLEAQGYDATRVIEVLIERHGARLAFSDGTNKLRCCGVTGSSTREKGALLIASWKNIADRRLGFGWQKGPLHLQASAEGMAAHG